MKNIVTILLMGCFFLNLSANDVYVAVDGDDKNPGTLERPLATLEEAFNRAVRCNSEGGVTIYMRGGTYLRTGPLKLNAGHSGLPGAPITVKPYDGEEVRVSGGMPIRNWRAIGGGVYEADVPEGVYFRQMFINDQIAIKARYPNGNQYLSTGYTTKNGLRLNVNMPNLGQSGLTPEDFVGAEVYARKVWAGAFLRVESVESFTDTGLRVKYDVPSSQSESRAVTFWNGYAKKPKICFRDSRAFLDVENEWFLDREAAKVYYIPPAGIDPNQASISAPTFERLFDFNGLSHVNFEGLILEQSGHFPLNDIYATAQGGADYTSRFLGGKRVVTDTLSISALELRNCKNITFRRNVVRNHSAAGIGLPRPNNGITIQGNAIYNIGGSGIQGHENWDCRKDSPLPPTSKNVLIADNYLVNIGSEIFSACGINFYAIHDSTFRNNTILGVINNGIHFGVNYLTQKKFGLSETRGIGYVKDLRVLNNYIENWLSFNYDGGGIHTLGFMLGANLVQHNVVNSAAPQCGIRCIGSGPEIYIDNSSTNLRVTENLLRGQLRNLNSVNDLSGSQNTGNNIAYKKFLFHQERFGLKLPRFPNNYAVSKFTGLTGAQQNVLNNSGVRAEYQDMEAYLPSPAYRIFENLKPGNRYEY